MRTSLLTPRRLLALIVVVLLVSSFLPQSRAIIVANPFKQVVDTMTAPIRQPLHFLGSTLRGGEPGSLNLGPAEAPALTHQYIRQLEQEIRRLQAENRRLSRIRQTVGESARIQLVDARVTGLSGSSSKPVLKIDRGTNAGIVPRAIVILGAQLVGEIQPEPGALIAEVLPIASKQTTLQVRFVPPTTEPALESSSLERVKWSSEEGAFVQQKSTLQNVQVGDLAHLADDGWGPEAQGFILGQVVSVGPDPKDPFMFKKIVVRPTYTLEQLRRVTVLVSVNE